MRARAHCALQTIYSQLLHMIIQRLCEFGEFKELRAEKTRFAKEFLCCLRLVGTIQETITLENVLLRHTVGSLIGWRDTLSSKISDFPTPVFNAIDTRITNQVRWTHKIAHLIMVDVPQHFPTLLNTRPPWILHVNLKLLMLKLHLVWMQHYTAQAISYDVLLIPTLNKYCFFFLRDLTLSDIV